MPLDESAPASLVIPEERGTSWRPWLLAGGIATVLVLGAWGSGLRPSRLWSSPVPTLNTLEVDRGDVVLVVTENGSLESADNATVRCQVEALIGTTGGAGGSQGNRSGTSGGQNAQQGGAAGAG